MHKPILSFHLSLLLLFCTLAVPTAGSFAQTATQKAPQSVILRPLMYRDARKLAAFIAQQEADSYMQLALPSLPSAEAVEKYLPQGTTLQGNRLTLPNGTDVTLVKTKSEKEYESEFRAKTITRGELITMLGNLPENSDLVVRVKRPGAKQWDTIGGKKRALEAGQTLPSGTYVVAETQNEAGRKITFHLPRLK